MNNADLDAAAVAMIDELPLDILMELQTKMAAMDAEYKQMGVNVPQLNIQLKARVKSRISKLVEPTTP